VLILQDNSIDNFISAIEKVPNYTVKGTIVSIKGLLIKCTGIHNFVSIGSRCAIITKGKKEIICEVIGLDGKIFSLMPFTGIEGVGLNSEIKLLQSQSCVYPDESWQGRLINAMGEPVDDKGMLKQGEKAYPYKSPPPSAHKRKRVGKKVDLGVKAINSFASCCRGQRLGIFAGSGVGKSMLIAMLTKYADADIKVIGLIGERGREVQEFIEDYLGEEGLKKAVIIVATSDESALMRSYAAYLTLSVAEYFRDIGKNVICLMDSVTRFAMAHREIGLTAGEPPASKGYTPTVFAELPKLLERAGPGIGEGDITGLFTVLVEGDDHNEPISDAVRGIIDGHVILDRKIAERGRFPAIDVLRSVSRTMPACNSTNENEIVTTAKALLSTYSDMEDMIRLGAYRQGADQNIDNAIQYYPELENFLKQDPHNSFSFEDCYSTLANILGMEYQSNNMVNNEDAKNAD
jgi:flagellum-specific ATP synthase